MGGVILIGAFLVVSCSLKTQRWHLKGSVMGTYYTVTYYGKINADKLKPELEDQLSAIDRQLSNWDEKSWISRFNRSKDTGFVKMPHHAQKVLTCYQKLHISTEGALDPTLGHLIQLWGFGPYKVDHPPDTASIRKALTTTGIEKISLKNDPPRIAKANPLLQLNVSAIAKGYAADVLAGQLESEGIRNYLINIGGDIHANGRPENQPSWKVSIQRPDPDARSGRAHATMELKNAGLATSGDYRRFLKENEKRYPHILDPGTGRPVKTDLASASIIAPTSMEADGIATASLVTGVQKARKMVEKMPEVEGLFIQRLPEHRYKTFTTSGWPDVKLKDKSQKAIGNNYSKFKSHFISLEEININKYPLFNNTSNNF